MPMLTLGRLGMTRPLVAEERRARAIEFLDGGELAAQGGFEILGGVPREIGGQVGAGGRVRAIHEVDEDGAVRERAEGGGDLVEVQAVADAEVMRDVERDREVAAEAVGGGGGGLAADA